MTPAKKRKFLALGLAVDCIILDQLSKYLVLRFWPHLASFNENIAFNLPVKNSIMLFATPLLLLVFSFFAVRYFSWKSWWSAAAYGLILGGGLSNYFDRIFRGAVVDFINFGFWPSFNIADSLLVVGAFLIILFHGKIMASHGNSSSSS